MTARRTVLGLALAGALALAGCAVVPEGAIRREGRFSLSAKTPQGVENVSGRFLYLKAPGLSRLDLLTPLSGVIARIERTPQGASIARGAADPLTGPDLDALLTAQLGFALPVDALEAMLTTPPAETETVAGDWRATVLSREASGAPSRLRFTHLTEPPVTVTILLDPTQE